MTGVMHKDIHKQELLQHVNSIYPAIQFTVETKKKDGAIPFLDTTVKPETDGALFITLYRKPTHMDQYPQWESHHHLSSLYSVIHTDSYRAQTVWSNPELLPKEEVLNTPGLDLKRHALAVGNVNSNNSSTSL